MEGIRKLADKLFTPNEIRRFQAYKSRFSQVSNRGRS